MVEGQSLVRTFDDSTAWGRVSQTEAEGLIRLDPAPWVCIEEVVRC